MKKGSQHRVPKNLEELYEVSSKILGGFPLSSGKKMPPEEIASREKGLRDEFNTLCAHLLSMAVAEIRVKGLHEKSHDPETDKVTINDAACIAVSFLFYRRKQSGLPEVIEIIRSLFRRNPEAGPVDLFNYLSAAVARNLSQSAKQKARFDNPWYYCVARCVDFHVRSRPRYEIEGKSVVDLEAEKPTHQSQSPSSEEAISLCNRVSPLPKKPGPAIDLIFDCLRESDAYDVRIHRQELYLAIYKLMTPHMTAEYPRTNILTPEDTHLLSSMQIEAYDLLGEMEESYNWRKIQDGMHRAAYLNAGEDILMDLLYFGERRNSHSEYLSAYLDGFAIENWREHKGSFQNFVKVLEKKWSEKLRAL